MSYNFDFASLYPGTKQQYNIAPEDFMLEQYLHEMKLKERRERLEKFFETNGLPQSQPIQ